MESNEDFIVTPNRHLKLGKIILQNGILSIEVKQKRRGSKMVTDTISEKEIKEQCEAKKAKSLTEHNQAARAV